MSAAIPPPPAPPRHPVTDSVRHALERSLHRCSELIPEPEWLQKLARSEATGVPLRIKLGLDPTAPDIHLGHTVVLNKLRELQDLGHTVIFLIGDFTSMIGDPSGRNTTRPPLTREQIEANASTYYAQASLVLDPDRTEIRYNSEWSDPLGARGMIELAARYTVARMMERDDFSRRFKDRFDLMIRQTRNDGRNHDCNRNSSLGQLPHGFESARWRGRAWLHRSGHTAIKCRDRHRDSGEIFFCHRLQDVDVARDQRRLCDDADGMLGPRHHFQDGSGNPALALDRLIGVGIAAKRDGRRPVARLREGPFQ